MKKLLFFISALLVASSGWAYDFLSNGIYYNIINGNEAEVTYEYENEDGDPKSPYSGNVVIPSSVTNGNTKYSVTSIGGSAFRRCSSLTSVTIPNSVTSIGDNAFHYCSGLTSVTIPNSVTSIGEAAFDGCNGLTSITIPNGVTSIEGWAFAYCRGLTSVTIPNGVTSIGDDAFYNCSGLTSVTIPNGVTSIGDEAFYNCSGLTSVTIPNGVTEIGEYAFKNCSGLTSITIPNSVTEIGYLAFWYVPLVIYTGSVSGSPWGATNVGGAIDENYVYKDAEKKIIFKYIGQKTDVVIPQTVTTIAAGAFSDSPAITSVTIPSSVTKVEDGAFSGCTALKNVTCLATVPPTAYANSFENYNGYLSIPCESKDDYDFASCWGSFKHVECIGAEPVELTKDEVAVVPEKNEAVFSMPKNESANSYTLTISNNGVTFCSLTFNAQGQLANIDFSTNKSYELKSGVEAFQFTVTGLSTASDYGYSFKALDNAKAVLKEYSGSFTTKNEDGTGGSAQGGSAQGEQGGEQGGEGGSTAVSEVSNTTAVTIVNGQILVNGEAPAFVVTVSGKKIANANLKSGVYFVVVDGNSVSVVVR